jgi:hypothetical protein
MILKLWFLKEGITKQGFKKIMGVREVATLSFLLLFAGV